MQILQFSPGSRNGFTNYSKGTHRFLWPTPQIWRGREPLFTPLCKYRAGGFYRRSERCSRLYLNKLNWFHGVGGFKTERKGLTSPRGWLGQDTSSTLSIRFTFYFTARSAISTTPVRLLMKPRAHTDSECCRYLVLSKGLETQRLPLIVLSFSADREAVAASPGQKLRAGRFKIYQQLRLH
jgi:hypothetical protein